jgi:citrate lyase gamma subunit
VFADAGIYGVLVRTPDPDAAGQYFTTNALDLTVSVPSDKPDLVVSNVVVGAVTTYPDGSYRLPVSYRVSNIGGVPAPAGWAVGAYIGTGTTAAFSDNVQEQFGYYQQADVLAAGASVDVTTVFVTVHDMGSGPHTLFVKADATASVTYGYDGVGWCRNEGCLLQEVVKGGPPTSPGIIAEESESNNVTALALTLPKKYDLVVSNVVVGAVTTYPDGSYRLPVSYRVSNIGEVPAPAGWAVGAYMGTGTAAAFSDNVQAQFGYYQRADVLAAGASVDVTTVFVTVHDMGSGPHTLFVKADATGDVPNLVAGMSRWS